MGVVLGDARSSFSSFLISSLASRRIWRTAVFASSPIAADLLDQLLAPLLGQRRDRDADQLAVVGRVEPEIRRPGSPSRSLAASTGRTAAPRSASARGSTAWPPGSAASASRSSRPSRRRGSPARPGRCAPWPASACASSTRGVHALVRRAARISFSVMRFTPHTTEPMSSPRTIRRMLPGSPDVEHDDRQPVVHAQRDRRGVHHLQAPLEHLEVADALRGARASGPSPDPRCRRRRPWSP